MNKTNRAKEYATALFMIAMEENKKKAYAAALETVVRELRENPDYVEFLCAPSIPMSERISSLHAAFSAQIMFTGRISDDALNAMSTLRRIFQGIIQQNRYQLADCLFISCHRKHRLNR